MRVIRYAGVGRLPRTLRVFTKLGVYRILDHYYESLFNPAHLRKPLSCGSSTLLSVRPIQMNHCDHPGYACEYVCIEPYEAEWLEKLDATVIPEPVE